MKKRLLSLALCVVMLFCVLSLTACGNNYESMVEDYITALYTGETEDFLNAMNYEAFWDILVDEGEWDEDDLEDAKDEFIDSWDKILEYYQAALEDEYGDDFDFDVEIMRSKELKNSELHDYEDSIEDNYDIEVEIDEGYSVKYKMTIDDESEKGEVTVVKINGEWVIG